MTKSTTKDSAARVDSNGDRLPALDECSHCGGDLDAAPERCPARGDEGRCVNTSSDARAVERIARLEAAKSEHAALKAWKVGGEQGERPSTPTLDEMTLQFEAAGCVPGSAGSTKRSRRSTSTRAAGMSDNDVLAAVREQFDADVLVTQGAVAKVLVPLGARVRSIRDAYKTVAVERRSDVEKARKAKSAKKPTSSKSTGIEGTTLGALNRKSAAAKSAETRKANAAAKSTSKSTTKPASSTSKSTSAAKSSKPAAKATKASKTTTTTSKSSAAKVTPNFKGTKASA